MKGRTARLDPLNEHHQVSLLEHVNAQHDQEMRHLHNYTLNLILFW